MSELIQAELDAGIPANRIIVGTFHFDFFHSNKIWDFENSKLCRFNAVFRLFVGGFSMGGALAIHSGYHVNRSLGGVFVCSGFLNNDSIVYESLKAIQMNADERNSLPPLLMFHGERDSLVPCEWGRKTFDKLTALGVNGIFTPLKNTMHELKTQEIGEIQEWIVKLLPPLDSDLTNKL